ncbi:SDR family oxidoreductase [Paenibacillus eucommiae]|uniref:NAD(P)-dependent dehydrogenase (Short-subunit alcohol dehydrogenase family) n=1 Tax=Paenibacillus eucommiae TaxID=1355755 RepID=A0ABS4IQY2_9BACL|nr:SDR family oxidoreductase [Paenibacillus eucommiae]MBP1989982.1 NAD(P)-dependent dehydrogenase (short-subunit alcohol dehydrogenase family) [Paenibacillus eucommiae]
MMIRTAFLTQAGGSVNRLIGYHLLARGIKLTVQFADPVDAEDFLSLLPEEQRHLCNPIVENPKALASIHELVLKSAHIMEGMDVFIHGNDWMDEAQLLDADPLSFTEVLESRIKQVFLYSRAAGNMMAKKKKGQIIFPLLADSLHYSEFPSSPVYNHSVIAFVKSLAKELAPFRITINALTFGFFRNEDLSEQWKAVRKTLDIYALKPPIPELSDLVKGLDVLLDHGSGLSGQNIHWGFGLDTTL